MGGPPVGAGRIVVRRRAHQRMPERDPIAFEVHDPTFLGGLQLGEAESLHGEGAPDSSEIAVRLRRGDEEGGQHGLGKPGEHEVDDPLAGRPDRQRIGQLGAPGALIGVDQVRRLDEHQGDPAAGGDELAADLGAVDPGIDEDAVGDVVVDGVEDVGRPGVGLRVGARPPGRHDRHPLELQPAGDVGEGPSRRSVDPGQVVDDHDDRSPLRRLHEQVTGGEGDGERFGRLVAGLDGERRPHGRRPRRGEVGEPPEQPVEQRGQPRPGHLELASTPAIWMMRAPGTSAPISSTAFARTAVLPIPGSPTTVRAPPWPSAAPSARATRVPIDRTAAGEDLVVVRRAQQEGRISGAGRNTGYPRCRAPPGLGRLSAWSRHPSGHEGVPMGAGARLAEERDRWEDHWRMVDLEREGEHLLDLLSPAEELRTAVPGLRTAADGESPVWSESPIGGFSSSVAGGRTPANDPGPGRVSASWTQLLMWRDWRGRRRSRWKPATPSRSTWTTTPWTGCGQPWTVWRASTGVG